MKKHGGRCKTCQAPRLMPSSHGVRPVTFAFLPASPQTALVAGAPRSRTAGSGHVGARLQPLQAGGLAQRPDYLIGAPAGNTRQFRATLLQRWQRARRAAQCAARKGARMRPRPPPVPMGEWLANGCCSRAPHFFPRACPFASRPAHRPSVAALPSSPTCKGTACRHACQPCHHTCARSDALGAQAPHALASAFETG